MKNNATFLGSAKAEIRVYYQNRVGAREPYDVGILLFTSAKGHEPANLEPKHMLTLQIEALRMLLTKMDMKTSWLMLPSSGTSTGKHAKQLSPLMAMTDDCAFLALRKTIGTMARPPRGPCARFRHMSLRCELASSRKTTFENEKGPPSYKGRGCSLGSGVRWRHRPSRRQCARGLCSRWRLLRLLRLLRVLRLLRCSVRTVEIDEGEDR